MFYQSLAIAVAPGIAIALLIYALDRRDREPARLLIRSFLLGVLCTSFPLLVEGWAARLQLDQGGILSTAFFAFGIVGLSEELGKYFVLRYFAFPKPEFNEPFDGIVYSVMVSMGFATTENIVYVMQYGIQTGLLRMFTSVPAHAAFAVLMGYYVGLAKFIPQHRKTLLFTGLFWAVAFHGAYDFFLLLNDSIFLVAASMLCLYIAVRLSIRAVKHHTEISERWNRRED